MILQVCVVRDRAANVYGTPFFAPSVGVAIRSFSDEVNRAAPDNNMNRHSEDFDLFHLGTFEDNGATFTCEAPRQLAVGKDVLQAKA